MENTPVGVRDYTDTLRAARVGGARIGAAVLNANPFTLGHLHLVRQALEQCDWLHIFVVAEDVSAIAYEDRLALVRAGVSGLSRVTVHGGSRYMISKGTFPNYFVKDKGVAEFCGTAVDLLMFRQYIAPALGITHRFVGTEPFCRVTCSYNADMHRWLEAKSGPGPAVHVVEVPRVELNGVPISASEVRHLLAQRDFDAIASLVPEATLACLRAKYAPV
jgi:[citrate (pro-3S)-lyase] ligase